VGVPSNYPIEPKIVWDQFFQISQIPRPSKKEEKIRGHIEKLAQDNGRQYKIDSAGNIVVYVPATPGKEGHKSVIIQNHMDMVCDAIPDLGFDFDNDPIELEVKGDWLCAKGTTLGADNGIGMAAAAAFIVDTDHPHPALELLFTSDEETGLHGANGLDASMLSGKYLINLDTEEWGSFYIGCAGGVDYNLRRTWERVQASSGARAYDLIFKGACGGHSGIDIHRQRANAIVVLSQVMSSAKKSGIHFSISSFDGGKAHNIIPRQCSAGLFIDEKNLDVLHGFLRGEMERLSTYLPEEDGNFDLLLQKSDAADEKVLSESDGTSLLNLLAIFPHGAHSFVMKSDETLVSLSNNLAIFKLENGELHINTSLRFFDQNELAGLKNRVESLASTFGLDLEESGGYPSWKPDYDNSLLDLAKSLYKKQYGHDPDVRAIHAGLECGILLEKIGKMDSISFGPTITGAHSPSEQVKIGDVKLMWELLLSLLDSL
jgi:dipeptidase D